MIYFILLFCSVLLQSFFSGIEIGLISSFKPRVSHLAGKGCRRAGIIEFFLNRPHLMLSTTLVGTNICIVCASLFAEKTAIAWGFRSSSEIFVVSIILTLALLCAEIIPKNWFRQSPEERCMLFAPLLYMVYFILYIPAKIMAKMTSESIKMFSREENRRDQNAVLLREDFRLLIRDSERGGSIDSETADILDRTLDFYNLKVKDVLTPLDQVISISAAATIHDAAKLCNEHDLSRMPIRSRRSSNEAPEWVGIFSIYDAIYNIDRERWATTKVTGCLRSIYSIAVSEEIPEIMKRSKAVNCRMLAVRDKNGSPAGVVTPVDVAKILFS